MTSQTLAVLFGAAFSLALFYVPGLNVRYAALSDEYKQFVALAGIVALGLAAFGLSCVGWFPQLGVVCSGQGAQDLIVVILNTLLGNAGMYVAANHLPYTGKWIQAKKANEQPTV